MKETIEKVVTGVTILLVLAAISLSCTLVALIKDGELTINETVQYFISLAAVIVALRCLTLLNNLKEDE